MNELIRAYQRLRLDGSRIGLEAGDAVGDCFCTPVGAEVLGWDNGIHYCRVPGFGETIFCVNPESCCDRLVYPVAGDFREFLQLILSVGSANCLQQIILWDREAFEAFQREPDTVEWNESPETRAVLDAIRTKLQLQPAEDPFGRVKALQQDFPYERIPFSNAYYDTLGLDRPDGSEQEEICAEAKTEMCGFVRFDAPADTE